MIACRFCATGLSERRREGNGSTRERRFMRQLFRLLQLLKFSWLEQVAASPSTPAGGRWVSVNIKSRSLTSKNYSPMQGGWRDFIFPPCKPLTSLKEREPGGGGGKDVGKARAKIQRLRRPRALADPAINYTRTKLYQDLNVLLVCNDPACSYTFWSLSQRVNHRVCRGTLTATLITTPCYTSTRVT